MEIVLARSAGMCMGVKRAISMARKAARKEGRPVYTYGPLIHNPQELDRLRSEGIAPLSGDEVPPRAVVIIRAHGVTPQVLERLGAASERLIDATCPKVASIHERIRDFTHDGSAVLIAGDPDHPEVEGLLGYAEGPAYVVASPEEVDGLPELPRLLLVAQTTQDEERYEEIRARVLSRFPEAVTLDTICSSTRRRQAELRSMVGAVDAVVVVGGRNSANTRRLYTISLELGLKAYHVESVRELPLEELRGLATVGVTAGASTPQWIVDEVVTALEGL